eukprot:TRINITY_DN10088_c0_g1_i3.p1 TRINITY_DN10088_c0_g1~~TRINITY_DN10088_c0_g1_i3.p1  ORF type:complete len:1644 (-),score=470.94 TRINITY_DN10088_c0_g1_i3:125-5056(-)
MEARLCAQILDLRSQTSQGPTGRRLARSADLQERFSVGSIASGGGGGVDHLKAVVFKQQRDAEGSSSGQQSTTGGPQLQPSTPIAHKLQQAAMRRLSRSANSSVDAFRPILSHADKDLSSSPSLVASSPQNSPADGGTGGTRPSPKSAHRSTSAISSPKASARLGSSSPSPKIHHRLTGPGNGQSHSVGAPPSSVRAAEKGYSGTCTPIPAVGFETLCAVLHTQLACWGQLEVATQQIFSGIAKSELASGLGSFTMLHFQELVSDMGKQSARLRQVLETTLASRSSMQHLRRGRSSPSPIDMEASLRAENERLVAERAEMSRRLAQHQADNERRKAESAATDEANKAEMSRQKAEYELERQKLEQEKEALIRQMSTTQAESLRKMAMEEAEMANKMERLHKESERRIQSERAQAEKRAAEIMEKTERQKEKLRGQMEQELERVKEETERKLLLERQAASHRLAESRQQTEKQLQKERQVTNDIMHVLRELPPLQTAMELGDLALLDEELEKWRPDALGSDRFGDCKGVVEAVVKLAQERRVTWREVECTWKDVMKEVEHLPTSTSVLTRQSHRIFRVLKEAQLTKIDLRRSDAQAMERALQVFLAWQSRTMLHPNEVQRLIVRKAVLWPQLGSFDFADLDICLRLVDRENCDAFLSRAKALVQDESTAPQDLKPLLAHIETMLFFLKYATKEDLQLAHTEFRKQTAEPAVVEYMQWAATEYPPGTELVNVSADKDLLDGQNVGTVLQELRKPRSSGLFSKTRDGLGPFREFFYQWAVAMHQKFNLLVLPHHTQAICLLIFRRFLEKENGAHTLIAQVGTGEGKSMIIAALAAYVVVVLKKKVHVVVDDETLLERDFESFKCVFDAFEIPGTGMYGKSRKLSAVLCVSEERLAQRTNNDGSVRNRVDADADICYCEAKHVQSFYASVARSDSRDFKGYNDRVLILDEVDALVIDEEPNDVFVYPNKELSEMATAMAKALAQGQAVETVIQGNTHPAAKRVASEMTKEWARGKGMVAGKEFVFLKDSGRYCALQAGRANPKTWSLALECRNFQDRLGREILFQERLFAASRPRVFRKYHRIMGLSGSIGSKPEQGFLRDTYGAAFFTVPPFLKTCRGSPFHDATLVRLGQQQRQVYLEANQEAQIARLVEVAFDARERVPVLVIAKDRGMAETLVERLRAVARSRGMGALCEDMVRSLSRTLYESNPEQWKENLNRCTLPLGQESSAGRAKAWRVTITDPRGGRGTDYRVDDPSVDAHGGLLLIPTVVPSSRREWTQFLGRTARQDCRGQYCCVLCSDDYKDVSQKFKEMLPSAGGNEIIETILRWGDRQSSERIQGSAALYNCGLRMNELCEYIFGSRADYLEDPRSRECLVEACQRFRWLSVREVDDHFRQLPGSFDPSRVTTESRDMGRPADAGAIGATRTDGVERVSKNGGGPKVVMFCLDWSCSMKSRDTGTPMTRFETMMACFHRIMKEQILDQDLVGCVVFGPDVRIVFPPTPKGQGLRMMEAQMANLRPQNVGGTRFFDAVAQCLQLLQQQATAPDRRWIVCLTDGDDLGSHPQNSQGQMVSQMLRDGHARNLNMVVVTVGALKALNVQIINSWTERIRAQGNFGRHLPERDAASIAKAFDVVAECLAVEVGGAVEC